MSGREYLQLAGRLRGIARRLLEPKTDALLRLLGLWEDRLSPLASYSKGMRQKILLLAALLHDPQIMILDEPFSGLDVNAAMILRSLLRSLAERKKIILYSSHVLEVVEKVCDTVLILRRGQVVAHDRVVRLREIMAESSLEGLFAQLTQPEDIRRRCAPLARRGSRMIERWRQWLEETHSDNFELVRHFAGGFFDNEMLSIPGERVKVVVGVFAVLVSMGFVTFTTFYSLFNQMEGPLTKADIFIEIRGNELFGNFWRDQLAWK